MKFRIILDITAAHGPLQTDTIISTRWFNYIPYTCKYTNLLNCPIPDMLDR